MRATRDPGEALAARVVTAPQVLGGELTAILLSGEWGTPEFVLQRVFQQDTGGA